MALLPPVPAAYLPDAHGMHADRAALLYLPLAHTKQSPTDAPAAAAYRPAPQSTQTLEPRPAYLPGAQLAHTLCATAPAYCVAGHITQPVADVTLEARPTSQSTHAVAPGTPVYVPTPQAPQMDAEAPVPDAAVPAAHATHDVLPAAA